jgi:uncharacterized protein
VAMYDPAVSRRGYGVSTNLLFGQTMSYVALTAGLFALGAYAGRDLGSGAALIPFVAAFGCLIAMRFTARRAATATVVLLLAFGLLMGFALAPGLAYYASVDPQALWKAGLATTLFVGALGSAGYATSRDLSGLARGLFWALLALLVFGVVTVFVHIPGGSMLYSVLGLVIFGGFTMVDFQRLRRNTEAAYAPLLAASIFLDILNVFLFFLRIFTGRRD